MTTWMWKDIKILISKDLESTERALVEPIFRSQANLMVYQDATLKCHFNSRSWVCSFWKLLCMMWIKQQLRDYKVSTEVVSSMAIIVLSQSHKIWLIIQEPRTSTSVIILLEIISRKNMSPLHMWRLKINKLLLETRFKELCTKLANIFTKPLQKTRFKDLYTRLELLELNMVVKDEQKLG